LSFLFFWFFKNIFPSYFRLAFFFPSFHFLFWFLKKYSSFPLLIRCFFWPYFLILLFLCFVSFFYHFFPLSFFNLC
jgi:hypothetical protein